jgi:hypothetical protein
MQYFRMVRTLSIGTLLIEITFERSEDIPCGHMLDHAETVVDCATQIVNEDDAPGLIAAKLICTFNHVYCVKVVDSSTNEGVSAYERS